ncbi:MAG TPA: L-cystine transporter [Gammaproteobacteria bacterium]|uniref:Cation:dicarboxylase symporter family transporter n=1 Tax=OM182 bacterium TaxID=2510334 RepID=A0A520S2V4_9GAMM|nr:L-cystine transporter [Gammaproteobacteria bacterium]RPG44100.1 MAG: L-cystine transporter [Gammaproteobacteria bacterium TMED163]RZO76803.1 MAG: cation:dicarboxylase symporter family transporter [OM182 bacterium]RPG44448.1 MAG: L-cystine transporter [Gammaproteobacteria bacterium TMED163]HAO89299.1 L-cystine transporter [Gammaproteobacteria bacterium]
MSMYGIFNLILFAALLGFLFQLSKMGMGLSRRVLVGLVLGSIFGFYLQLVFGLTAVATSETLEWTNVVGNSYVNLLRMIIIPLVLITMMASVLRVEEIKSLGKIGGTVVGILVLTTMVAASIGIVMATLFGLNAGELASGARELARAEVLESRLATDRSISQLLTGMVPRNIFADMSEARPTSIIAVAIFGMLIGVAALLVSEEDKEHGSRIKSFVDTTQAVIMRLVKLVISLTPYGVMALMTRVIATTDGGAILTLISFVIASYIAIGLMFLVHGLLIAFTGANVREYFQKVWPVLTFAFATRSSAATIPLTIRAQIEELKVPPPIANISASFGATIGQNGCAGLYPAMLAVMVAPTVGVDPDIGFIASLLVVVAIGSFGIAGVGGGATNAALVVLPAMGFPVTVAALLISIEPLIDMGRTALNVNGAITTGLLTNRFLGDEVEDTLPNIAAQGLQEN